MKFRRFHFHKLQLTFFIPRQPCHQLQGHFPVWLSPDHFSSSSSFSLWGEGALCCDRISNRYTITLSLFRGWLTAGFYSCSRNYFSGPSCRTRGDSLHNCQSHRKLSLSSNNISSIKLLCNLFPLFSLLFSSAWPFLPGQACHWAVGQPDRLADRKEERTWKRNNANQWGAHSINLNRTMVPSV